jgi:hypothetical protein
MRGLAVVISADLTSLGEAYRRENPDLRMRTSCLMPLECRAHMDRALIGRRPHQRHLLSVDSISGRVSAGGRAGCPDDVLSPIGWRAPVQPVRRR